MTSKKDKKTTIRTLMQPLEKRLLLDASTLESTVNAIPNGVLNLDAQDIDGDGDFSAGDQPTNGSTVQTWHDKFGGIDNDAVENTASRRATYQDNAFGTGIGGLVFDGNDTYTVNPENSINVAGPFPEKSFAAVFRTGTDTSGFQMIFEQGGNVRGFQISIDNGNIYAAGYNNTGSEWGADRYKIMNLGAVQANTTYRVIMVFDSTVGDGFIKANLNGGAFVQLDEVGSQANHSGNDGIGAEQGGTVRPSTLALTNNSDVNFFQGAIGQIMSWNTALDDNQVRAVDAYLVHKWTNSPAIQFNTGDTVLEGGSTNIDSTELYTVDRNTGPASLTYQVTGYSNGFIERSGVALAINGTFTQDDIDNGLIDFIHDDSETITANFSYRVTDGGTQDTDIFYLDVIPVDDGGSDPPAISNNTTQTVVESASVTITSADLLIIDVDTTASNLDFTVTSTLNGSVFNTNLATTVTTFTQADIDNGFIRFDHDGTVNGFAGFDFDVTDGTTTISGTKDINVTFPGGAGNDPPVITVNTGDTVNTAGSRFITNTNLKTSDPDNSIDELIYTITSVTNGTVFRNGVALSVSDTFTQEDINFGLVQFTHDGSATATAQIGFDVTDGNTNVTGNTYDFGVVSNSPPDIGPDPAAVNVFENATNGTLIYTASATDPDGDGLTYTIESGNGLGIFQVNPFNGQVTIADNTNLDFEGTNTFSLVIRATDDGVGNEFDELTLTINIQNVNEEPSGTDNTITTNEDIPHTFSAADFGFTDADDTPANSFQSVVITTLPANGALTLSGVAVTAGQEILATDIPNLVFTPAVNDSGVGYDSFTFQVRDDGGTANGGVNLDATPNTITFDVNSVNDAPDGADITISTNEDTTYTFALADFAGGFTDTNDTPSNLPQSVIITTLPTDGVLELSGVAITAGQEITAAQIPNITFTPAANENGTGYASFTYQIRDDGGTVNGGVDLDGTPNTVTIDVTPVNDAPDGTDNTITINEDNIHTFAAVDFGFSDVDDTPANNLQFVTITTLPVDGILELSGTAVTAGQVITAAQIPNLTFTPAANESGTGYASFTFQVQDDGGTASGGIDLDATANTITFDVTEVNDAPDGADNTLSTNEDTAYTFATADFGFSDADDTPANNLQSVVITTLPTNGVLELLGVAVTAGQNIALADIPNLTFTPAANESGVGYDTFTFQVRDDGGTANGGVDLDAAPNTITFDVLNINDAPDGTDNTVTTLEDTDYTFDPSDFGFTDVNDTPADNFQSVVITTLPTNGTLELSGVAVTAGQEITVGDIPNLTFTPVANENGTTYDTFTFQVRDDGGTANGGINLDGVANTMTIDVTAVNDAPDGADNTITINEDNSHIFALSDFGFADADDTPANNFQSVTITTLPTNGVLELSGVAVTAGQVITVAQVPNLTFTPAANANGTGYDSFTFQVTDDGGTANSGGDTDQTANTITFDVTSVNDAPDGADNTVSTDEDIPLVFSAADFGFSDINDGPDNFQSVFITTLPADGILELSGTAVTAGQEIAVGDIPNLTFTPAAGESGSGYTTFTFQVRDDGGTPNGGEDTDQTANIMTIDVNDVNDAPDGTDNTITTLENNVYTFADADFGFTDANDLIANNFQSVFITTLPANGVIELSGVAVTAGQEITFADIPNLTYTPPINSNGVGFDTFTFQVRDDGGTANGGVDTDPTPNTITFDVDPINSAPDGTDNTITIAEDTPHTFAATDFGFTDTGDTPANNFQSVIITTIPAIGALQLSGVAVTAGQEITVADIPNLVFTPA
ncbi:MAG: cadherin-like domain-containing protein [Alphaproteobacteria bacterium]